MHTGTVCSSVSSVWACVYLLPCIYVRKHIFLIVSLKERYLTFSCPLSPHRAVRTNTDEAWQCDRQVRVSVSEMQDRGVVDSWEGGRRRKDSSDQLLSG